MAEIYTPPCPSYLAGSLAARYEILAPRLAAMGSLDDLTADLVAKYILAENEYLKISDLVQEAIRNGEPDAASKWINAQDKLTKQILQLGGTLGITPDARRSRGLLLSNA